MPTPYRFHFSRCFGLILCLGVAGPVMAQNISETVQLGIENSASTVQAGRNFSVTLQQGLENIATVEQTGRYNLSALSQSGEGHEQSVTQTGDLGIYSSTQASTRLGGVALSRSGTAGGITTRFEALFD
jgi:hypothetical protein